MGSGSSDTAYPTMKRTAPELHGIEIPRAQIALKVAEKTARAAPIRAATVREWCGIVLRLCLEITTPMWGSLPSCVAVVNRHAGRLAIGPQVTNLPHSRSRL